MNGNYLDSICIEMQWLQTFSDKLSLLDEQIENNLTM